MLVVEIKTKATMYVIQLEIVNLLPKLTNCSDALPKSFIFRFFKYSIQNTYNFTNFKGKVNKCERKIYKLKTKYIEHVMF